MSENHEDCAVDEVARIAWWLRAGAVGPASVNHTAQELALVAHLATVLESGERPWAEAPTTRYPR